MGHFRPFWALFGHFPTRPLGDYTHPCAPPFFSFFFSKLIFVLKKMRPNTPHGRSGCHTFAAFGPRVPNLATKGPKGPICCQIWNGFGSIASVFGVPPNASCVSQNGLKMAQNRSKMAQSRVKMAQSGSKWPKIGPKIGVSGQNKHCQNTAERKLRPNTQRAQRMPYFCGLGAAGYQI